MPGVPKELIEHSLNVHATGFIKEVIHSEWVANPVLVKKKNNE
jgi:hypothetical protein